jgi:putative tricarboxylic transport membrane protein
MTDATLSKPDRPALIIGAALLILAGIVIADAMSQTIAATYGLGPTAMPYVVGSGLAILGIAHVVTAFRGGLPKPEPADRGALLWISGGLVGLIASIALGGGFILGTAILFAGTARGFGRRAVAVDLAIGAVMGFVIFIVFAKVLTLILPAGPLERLFL